MSRAVRQSRSDSRFYLCQDCNYKFNALAGTVFMGVKLPLTSYLQAFTIYNALGDTLSYRDMSFAIGAASRSTHGIIDRVRTTRRDIRFTTTERQPGVEPARGERENQAAASNNFFAFCAMRSILVDESAFLDYIEAVTNTPTNLVEVYGKRGRPRMADTRIADQAK
jgi:hypothetical protein